MLPSTECFQNPGLHTIFALCSSQAWMFSVSLEGRIGHWSSQGKIFCLVLFPAQTPLMKEKLTSFLWKLLSFMWTKIILNKRELCCCRKQTAIAGSLAISLAFPSLCPYLSVYKTCFTSLSGLYKAEMTSANKKLSVFWRKCWSCRKCKSGL